MWWSEHTENLIDLALAEDIGSGDVTTQAIVPQSQVATATFLAREEFVVCGLDLAEAVLKRVDATLHFHALSTEGALVTANTPIAEVNGSFASILTAERTALNFLQRMSGVATKTARIVALLEGTKTELIDTRKTTPGWRELEKYAVRVGGGANHRSGLYDLILIKNNHIDSQKGDVADCIRRARAGAPAGIQVEVEVRNEAELLAALSENPDIIMLDNMTTEELLASVAKIRAHSEQILIEASGGITERNVRAVAETGVDLISMGSLTHSARAMDISLRYAHKS